ncbi:Gustatory and odorant receptor 22 [Folsomia candida]|uniref:Gustatory and odorant receptor 22 n=1 Tax=Folsomia candida TaxID=158441 RepID=A0A226DZ53_FOLCA|nr:Gustatory and odorant receptor 22 [Folsomia candida]
MEQLKNLTVSEILLKISKIAMLSSQIAGYLPLSVNHEDHQNSPLKKSRHKNLLTHSLTSIPTMSSFLGLFVIIGWTTLYYSIFKPKIQFVRIFGPTESFAYTMIVIMGSTAGIILRLGAFRKGEVNFFQDNCNLLQNFEDRDLKVSEMREISKIPRYINISFSAYFIPLVIHCILVHGVHPMMAYYKFGKWHPDIVYTIGSGFWVFWSYLLISNLWIILFPRLYSACYKEISKNISMKFQNGIHQPIKSNYFLSEIWKPQSKNGDVNQRQKIFENIYGNKNLGKITHDAALESKVEDYLELILNLGKMIEKFNKVFGERLMLEMITCITFIVLYAFFGCFWLNRGNIRVIGEVITPLYVNGKKLIELGYSCGSISNEAQVAMKTLINNVPLDKLSLKMCRKIRLIQIQLESSPPTVSAKQFFTISRGSVTTVLQGMAGFLVALVQFRRGE